jgi:hypothetical protein
MNRKEYVMQPKLRMDAYYFGFSATGVREIDEILSAVACAGKAYHHTERWNDADEGEWSYAELIQHAATRAAARIADLEKALRDVAEAKMPGLARYIARTTLEASGGGGGE